MQAFISLTLLGLVFRFTVFYYNEDKAQAWWMAYCFTPSCVDCFGLGAVLAHLRMNNREYFRALLSKTWIPFLSFAAYLLLVFYEVYYPNNLISITFIRFTCAVSCFFIIGKASEHQFNGLIGKFLEAKPIVYLGKISYGLYVYHYIIPWVLDRAHIPMAQVFYLPVTIIVSALSWHLFEAPINRLKDKFEYFNAKKAIA